MLVLCWTIGGRVCGWGISEGLIHVRVKKADRHYLSPWNYNSEILILQKPMVARIRPGYDICIIDCQCKFLGIFIPVPAHQGNQCYVRLIDAHRSIAQSPPDVRFRGFQCNFDKLFLLNRFYEKQFDTVPTLSGSFYRRLLLVPYPITYIG